MILLDEMEKLSYLQIEEQRKREMMDSTRSYLLQHEILSEA